MNIKQVSDYTGISRDMIRFYEKKGIIHPARKENGYRDYTIHDLLLLVTARQYSCLGIPLSTIAQLSREQDTSLIQRELHASAARIEEETFWLSQQLFTAKYMEQIFRMASENRQFEVIKHTSFVYYERTSANHFQNQLASISARPVLRIRNRLLEKDAYPNDQGMVFQKPLRTQQPFESYAEGTFFRFLFTLPADAKLPPSAVRPMLKQIRENGYSPSGDAFLTMLLGTPDRSTDDLIVLEFEIQKAK